MSTLLIKQLVLMLTTIVHLRVYTVLKCISLSAFTFFQCTITNSKRQNLILIFELWCSHLNQMNEYVRVCTVLVCTFMCRSSTRNNKLTHLSIMETRLPDLSFYSYLL